jgi:uncharacterized membrane protein YbhN (UPF0104 family)
MTVRRLAFVFRCLFSAVLIAFVLRKIDWAALFEIVRHLDPVWALSASILTGVWIIGLCIRWRLFLRASGIDLPFNTVLALTWAGQFFNSILPGSTGGDVVKIYQVCRLNPGNKAAAAATVLADRLTALLALVLLAGAGLAFNPLPVRILSRGPFSTGNTIYWLLGAGCFLLLVGVLLIWVARGTLWGGRVLRTMAAAKNTFTLQQRWPTAFLVSLATHLVTISIAYLFARSLGISLTYYQALLMMPAIALFVMLPLTINGHGLRELLLIAYFTEMATTVSGSVGGSIRETAIAFSLLMVANDLLWALPGGIIYTRRFKTVENHSVPKPDANQKRMTGKPAEQL